MGRLKHLKKALDMSTEARMARAKEMGFDTSEMLFHSTDREIFGPMDSGTYYTPSAEYSARYGRGEGQQMIPVYIRKSDAIDARDSNGARLWREFLSELSYSEGYEPRLGESGAIDYLDENKFTNWYIGKYGDLPPAVWVDENNGEVALRVYDQNIARSVNAAFDPEKAASPNLLAGVAGTAVGAGLLAPGDAEAEEGNSKKGGSQRLSDFASRRAMKKDLWGRVKVGGEVMVDALGAMVAPALVAPTTLMDYAQGMPAEQMERNVQGRTEMLTPESSPEAQQMSDMVMRSFVDGVPLPGWLKERMSGGDVFESLPDRERIAAKAVTDLF